MRRAKSLRIGVHHANAVVWGPVYRTHLRALLRGERLRDRFFLLLRGVRPRHHRADVVRRREAIVHLRGREAARGEEGRKEGRKGVVTVGGEDATNECNLIRGRSRRVGPALEVAP